MGPGRKDAEVFNVGLDAAEGKPMGVSGHAPSNITKGEMHLLHQAGWKKGVPLVPALRKAGATLWSAWVASRQREGSWTSEIKVAGSHARTNNGKGGCKGKPFDACFSCCDSGAWDCHCKASGSLISKAATACSSGVSEQQCAVDALRWLPTTGAKDLSGPTKVPL